MSFISKTLIIIALWLVQGFPAVCQTMLLDLRTPILFQGNGSIAYRDPAVLFHNNQFYLFFTLVEVEDDGQVFSYTATSQSRDLLCWSQPVKITPRNQYLNYCSPGNVIRFDNEWVLCLQTYPRPGHLVTQPVRYGTQDAWVLLCAAMTWPSGADQNYSKLKVTMYLWRKWDE